MPNGRRFTGNTMRSPDLFFDSCTLFAGVVSPSGAARALLLLAEAGQIRVTVSEQVITETERALARKIPRAIPHFRLALRASNIRIVKNPSVQDVQADLSLMKHSTDVPILLAAREARTDFLVTLNTRHFIDDPTVAERAGLRIGTPGDALDWVRPHLIKEGEHVLKYRAVRDYQAAYSNPLAIRAGESVQVTDRTSEWPGWLWCENREGTGGWVPENYLQREGSRGEARRDYTAVELTVRAGEELLPAGEESGWAWCSNREGKSGWVPISHLERIP